MKASRQLFFAMLYNLNLCLTNDFQNRCENFYVKKKPASGGMSRIRARQKPKFENSSLKSELTMDNQKAKIEQKLFTDKDLTGSALNMML